MTAAATTKPSLRVDDSFLHAQVQISRCCRCVVEASFQRCESATVDLCMGRGCHRFMVVGRRRRANCWDVFRISLWLRVLCVPSTSMLALLRDLPKTQLSPRLRPRYLPAAAQWPRRLPLLHSQAFCPPPRILNNVPYHHIQRLCSPMP